MGSLLGNHPGEAAKEVSLTRVSHYDHIYGCGTGYPLHPPISPAGKQRSREVKSWITEQVGEPGPERRSAMAQTPLPVPQTGDLSAARVLSWAKLRVFCTRLLRLSAQLALKTGHKAVHFFVQVKNNTESQHCAEPVPSPVLSVQWEILICRVPSFPLAPGLSLPKDKSGKGGRI